MTKLSSFKCEACNALTPKLTEAEIRDLMGQVASWQLSDGRLFKGWKFKDFVMALEFVNKVSRIAEEEGHHPNINFGWGFVEITIWTHVINGLSRNDFILAGKIDEI